MAVQNFKIEAEIYDLQVNWPKRLEKEKDFFIKLINKKKINSILDIGCGTGHHAQLFSSHVEKVVAIDPAPDMIEYAGKNVVRAGNVKLLNAGFEDLGKIIPEQKFDLITSLGNTLALLGSRKKVKQALKKTYSKLSAGGLAVFQFLNFNAEVLEENRYYTPKIFQKEGKTYSFIKHFEYGKIKTRTDFVINVLKDNNLDGFFVNTSYMCTLKVSLFTKMAKNAGFKSIEFLGTGGQVPFDSKKHISLYALCAR